MTGRLRFALVVAGIAPVLLLLVPLQLLALGAIGLRPLRPAARAVAGRLPVLFHRTLLALAGIRVVRRGQLHPGRPLLLVANHISWLDIVVVGSLAPVSFVAKDEMRTWPVFGWLARMQRTVFIARDRRRSVGEQAGAIASRLAAGEAIVLFPEGTTSDGHQVLPFKTALFEAARFALVEGEMERGAVQPVGLDYARAHGMALDRAGRARFAWPGEIGLGESLIDTFGGTALDVVVRFGHPIELTPQSDRKAVSAQARGAIRDLLAPRSHRLDTSGHAP